MEPRGSRRTRSASGDTSGHRKKTWDNGKEFLRSLTNEDHPDRDKVEEEACEAASERPDARGSDDDDMRKIEAAC
eukprot:7552058-Karenia_brevis.AAC.1